MRLGITHCVHEIDDYIGIKSRIAFELNRSADTLNASLGIRERSFLLRIAYAGKDNIRTFGSLCHKQFLDNEEIKTSECLLYVLGIGIRNKRVLTADIKSLDIALDRSRENIRSLKTRLGIKLYSPRLLELGSYFIVVYLLVSRVIRGKCTHVAGTLHVVLTS